MSDLELALSFLFGQSEQSLITVFWYALVFELPRYGLAIIAVGIAPLMANWGAHRQNRPAFVANEMAPRVSVIIVGHNEVDALEACVRSLREQSFQGFEIVIVSDGSNDGMVQLANRLVRRGRADRALSTDLRGGKSSGVNLAIRAATADIIVNVDCDWSFDRFAIANIVEPFSDPAVGAVTGEFVPRNSDLSLLARFQEIEYLMTISMGKRLGNALDQVVCASGAFGAFRRAALDQVGGADVGGGEDLDLTLRIRQAGWRVVFAENATCYTDVPAKLWPLVRQRFRWERDAFWLRYRKHLRLMDPRSARFHLSEAFHQWDFLMFNVVGAAIFPCYIVWLFLNYADFALPILIAMQFGLLLADIALLAISALVIQRPLFFRNLPYLLGYSTFTTYCMRIVIVRLHRGTAVFRLAPRQLRAPESALIAPLVKLCNGCARDRVSIPWQASNAPAVPLGAAGPMSDC
jgi:cellulose synthase/poly-beta-1,6-N-acetylglucosamine synthase-like glycosyltransferase